MARLVLYHFSDLHFRQSDDFNRQIVLRALWEDIKRQMISGLVPDCIAVTGDIAWSGKAEEYKRAEAEFFLPLLESTNLSRDGIFMVPGNHDVDRDVLSDVNPDKIASLNDRDSINDFIAQPRTLSRYLASFEAFREFEASFAGIASSSTHIPLAYCRHVTLQKNVAIVGLNTSWTSGYSGIPNRGSTEQGWLLIGERQLLEAVEPARGMDLVLVLMHHPLYWLADFDKAAVEPLLASHADVVLHGHVHRPSELSSILGTNGGYLNLGAGAAYDRRVGVEPYVNSYSIVEIDLNDRTANITLRKYVDSPIPRWTSHEDLMGEGSQGVRRFFIPSSTARGVLVARDHEKRQFSSIREIFRALKGYADFFARADSHLNRTDSTTSTSLTRIFERLITEWVSSAELPPTLSLGASILLGKAVLAQIDNLLDVKQLPKGVETILAQFLAASPADEVRRELEKALSLLTSIARHTS